MAITKSTEIPKIEVVGTWNIQVATDTIIKEDGTEISRSRNRHVLQPYSSELKRKIVDDMSVPDLDANGKTQWTYTATDISAEDDSVKDICGVMWTDTVKANYKTFVESQEV